jgi:hypothetical protein
LGEIVGPQQNQGDVQKFPSTLNTCPAFPIINVLDLRGAFGTTEEHWHIISIKAVVYIRFHSCASYRFWHLCTLIVSHGIVFSVLKSVLCLFVPSSILTSRNHQSFFSLHHFAFSRMSYSCNHSMYLFLIVFFYLAIYI